MVKRNNRFQIERLEDRKMMAGDTPMLLLDAIPTGGGDMVLVGGAQGGEVGTFPGEAYDPNHLPESVRDQQMGLPMLDSLPGAHATLFLDFTGSFESHWSQTIGGNTNHYVNVVTPAYDNDFNPTSFSATEQQEIRNIWAAVAEDFAPFGINVTTHYYGSLGNNEALKVAIGGDDDDWLVRAETANPTGTSVRGSFYNSSPNTVFVFENNFVWNGSSDYQWKVANVASHEAGHAFGLRHLSKWGADGKLSNPYDPGTNVWTPIMGQATQTDRTTWSLGTSELGPKSLQDDMKILAGSQNGFGYRADDHGGWIDTATPLAAPMTAFQATTGKGVITKTTDTDMFSFTTSGGSIEIRVNGAPQKIANLIPKVQLFNAAGRQVSFAAGQSYLHMANGTEAVLNTTLPAGTYYASVSSLGDYGNVGQYTISVKNVASNSKGTTPTTPKGGLYAMDGSLTTVTAPKSKTVAAPKGESMYASDEASAEPSIDKVNYATKLTSPMPVVKVAAKSRPGSLRYEHLDEAFAGFGSRFA
jgi:hypothetical protein